MILNIAIMTTLMIIVVSIYTEMHTYFSGTRWSNSVYSKLADLNRGYETKSGWTPGAAAGDRRFVYPIKQDLLSIHAPTPNE